MNRLREHAKNNTGISISIGYLDLMEEFDRKGLTPEEQAVLIEYYILHVGQWKQVAENLHYSEPRVFQFRRSALEKLQKDNS